MIGVDAPIPGIAVFHATLVVSLHSSGGLPAASPVPSGPRQDGQFAAAVVGSDLVSCVASTDADTPCKKQDLTPSSPTARTTTVRGSDAIAAHSTSAERAGLTLRVPQTYAERAGCRTHLLGT